MPSGFLRIATPNEPRASSRYFAVVLGFVGLKLGFGYFGYDIETGQSLAVIATVLGAGILASIYFPPDEGEESP